VVFGGRDGLLDLSVAHQRVTELYARWAELDGMRSGG